MGLVGQKVKYGGKSFSIVMGEGGPGFWITKGGVRVFISLKTAPPRGLSRGTLSAGRGLERFTDRSYDDLRSKGESHDEVGSVNVTGLPAAFLMDEMAAVLNYFEPFYAPDDQYGFLEEVRVTSSEIGTDAAGTYNSDEGIVRLTPRAEIGTFAHEVGHAVYYATEALGGRCEVLKKNMDKLFHDKGLSYRYEMLGSMAGKELGSLRTVPWPWFENFEFIPSAYGTINESEFWAECFEYYVLAPKMMERRMPTIFGWFEETF